mgnify:CR=1 FL=1
MKNVSICVMEMQIVIKTKRQRNLDSTLSNRVVKVLSVDVEEGDQQVPQINTGRFWHADGNRISVTWIVLRNEQYMKF